MSIYGMNAAPSLLDPPVVSPFVPAVEWVTGTLLGSVAVSLCVIAVAFQGLRMMSGHTAVRDGVRVALACFILLGASSIAAGLKAAADRVSPAAASQPVPALVFPEPPPLPPANYDPYAGASVRRD